MDSNLTAHYMANQISRSRLDTQAERGSRIEQARTAQSSGPSRSSLRQRLGTVLIRIGERMQGLPRPTIAVIGADPSSTPARTP